MDTSHNEFEVTNGDINLKDWHILKDIDRNKKGIEVYKSYQDGISEEEKEKYGVGNNGIIILAALKDQNDSYENKEFYQFYSDYINDFEANNYYLNLGSRSIKVDTMEFRSNKRFDILKQYRDMNNNLYIKAGVDTNISDDMLMAHFRFIVYHFNDVLYGNDTIAKDLIRSSKKRFILPITNE